MAAGDFKWFEQALVDLGNKIHNLSSDTLKAGIVTGVTPTATTAAPHWGGTGTTNYASSQVATGGTSYTGPFTLSSVSWAAATGGARLDFADKSLAKDASGFTDGGYLIVYNDTDANKRCLGFMPLSLSDAASLVSGAINITINASGALALVQS